MTPALADANNGNWQTAQRWSTMLTGAYRVHLASGWEQGGEALMIALHARRSAASIAAWRATGRPCVLVLTGTDLYRDIAGDADAQASIRSADRLVVLNELGLRQLPPRLRAKASVVLQSSRARRPLAKPAGHLRALMVGHLREEKAPATYFEAARLLADRADILLDHIGAALTPAFEAQAQALMADCPHYHWLGPLPHGTTLRHIQAAHVLVHTSRIEGGPHVVIEAVRSGTPVLASRIDGHVGLLGPGYGGYFPVGDAAALATLLRRSRDEPAMLGGLQAACAERGALFDPAHEREALRALVGDLLSRPPPPGARR